MRRSIRSSPRRRGVFSRGLATTLIAIPLAACSPNPAAQVAEGRELFEAQGCAACHGPQGQGGGVFQAADLRTAASFNHGHSIPEIEATLKAGIPPRMPSFSYLTDEERHLLALFVSSLADENPGQKTP